MDNVTHSLAGVALAQIALGRLPEPERRLLWTPLHLCAIVASNLPDLDMVYAGVTGGKLGYLLHHRGHTHTFVVAVLLALLLSAGCYTWFRRRQTPPRRALGLLAFSTLGGVGLHIGMDYGNSYGVHPWWPFDNHWYYGDSVFIIEPWLFAALAVPALFSVRTRVMRGILLLLLTVVTAAPWFLPLPRLSGIAMLLWTLLLALPWWVRRHEDHAWRGSRLVLAIGGFVAFYATAVASQRAAMATFSRDTLALYQARSESMIDLVATPAPATPWCWDLIAISTSETALHSRIVRLSLQPTWTAPEDCPPLHETATAKLEPNTTFIGETGSSVLVERENTLPLRTLEALAQECWSAAFLRFARAPFWVAEERILGDLRYDRTPGEDFAEITLPGGPGCPQFVPPWVAPRSDALTARPSPAPTLYRPIAKVAPSP